MAGRRRGSIAAIAHGRCLDAYLGNRRPHRRRQIGCRGDRQRILADPSGIVGIDRSDARDDRAASDVIVCDDSTRAIWPSTGAAGMTTVPLASVPDGLNSSVVQLLATVCEKPVEGETSTLL